MKNYLKLVNFEFNRVSKLFLVLLGITFITQVAGIIVLSRKYLSMGNERMQEEMISQAEFLAMSGPISFLDIARSLWFLGPIALCAAGVGFYIFLIWYRDWLGKNTFIYRLLMLPTARLNIFFAKITTILLMTFGFVAFQLLLLPIETKVFAWMVPTELRLDLGMIEIMTGLGLAELNMIFPVSISAFLLYYGTGLMVVAILFTAILMERSFKWKGIFAGIAYSVAAIVLFLSPLLLQELILDGWFYPVELLIAEIGTGLLVFALSIWMSGLLLKKKITV